MKCFILRFCVIVNDQHAPRLQIYHPFHVLPWKVNRGVQPVLEETRITFRGDPSLKRQLACAEGWNGKQWEEERCSDAAMVVWGCTFLKGVSKERTCLGQLAGPSPFGYDGPGCI